MTVHLYTVQLFVALLLSSCWDYKIRHNQRNKNDIPESVDQKAKLVATCLSNHCLCVCKYEVFNHCHVPVITTMK